MRLLTNFLGLDFQFSEFQTFPPSLAESPASIAPSPTNGLQGPYPPQANHFVQPGDKRKASAANLAPITDLEEQSRFAAEEDKRRRNTAASARFLVKKKMREQALEKSLKETNDKNDALEARVSQLELENHWLRGLIMEKNGTQERDEQSEKAISDMFKNYLASQNTDSSTSESKHGVGTFA